jgi:hypothetical protein
MLCIASPDGTAPQTALKHLDAKKLIAQMKNKAACHLMEALLLRTPPSFFDPLWTAIKPSFSSLCLNPVANFAAQSLIAAAPSGRYVADIMAELTPSLKDLIMHHRSGVVCVLATAAACWRVGCSEVCLAIEGAFEGGV